MSKNKQRNTLERDKYGKYKEGVEWKREKKLNKEHIIKKSAKRTYSG